MVDIFKQILGNISGGRVLDVATKEGRFVHILTEGLKAYDDILGIDIDGRAISGAQSAFDQETIQFIKMDGQWLGFGDACFDTVCIALSLHHVANIPQVLAEMKRVLKPGGHFILAEMHQDWQTEAQHMVASLHQWAAEIDSARGIPHNRTLTRQEVVDYVESLDLRDVAFHDVSDTDSDPMDEESLTGVEGVIDRVTDRARELPNYLEHKQRGETLRRRLHEVGVQSEPVLIMVGRK